MNKCHKSQNETAGTIQNINNGIMNERLRGHEYMQNVNIIQDLDSNKPQAFDLLYNFKLEDIETQINMSKEVAGFYRDSKNNSSVAKLSFLE